jgi:NADH-quinone oxidoreductase subunit C
MEYLAKFGESWKKQCAELQKKFKEKIEEIRMPSQYPTDVPIVYVKKEAIVEVLGFLKQEPEFEYNFLADITATDEETEPRFDVVYQLFSHQHFWRIRVKTRVSEGQEVPTVCSLWAGANWAEREVYDMFGIKFQGHPDLRRILMDSRWKGHPLRKDYPLKGYQIFSEPEPVDPTLLE